MASKQLFSMKDRAKVMPVPKQEFILGLFQAQRRPAKRQHHFPDERSALAAIHSGDVAMSDDIQIGKPKFEALGSEEPHIGPAHEDEPNIESGHHEEVDALKG